jgi:simple sugar transport system ATP-binding protein
MVEDLPVGTQQRAEIIKLLFRDADILILDEPTAVLTPQEVEELFKILRLLVDKGKSIIFITHKLAEVMRCADRITVIRNGKVIGTTTPKQSSTNDLANMMVGREVDLQVEKNAVNKGDVVLSVNNLKIPDQSNHLCVNNVSFEVRAGEILGIAGVQGNGQTELVRSLTGLLPALDGSIQILGQDTTRSSPRKITELGSAHIPEDRQKDGLVLDFSVADNLVLNTYYLPQFSNGIIADENKVLENGKELVEGFDIRTPGTTTKVSSLSGGNQQKVIVAREFSRPIKLLIASQPTRGLDVGSIEYIHQRLIEKRDEGTAVLIVSTELDEILQLADRIAVIYRGEIIEVLDSDQASKEVVGLLMAGIRPDEETLKNARAKKEKIIMT